MSETLKLAVHTMQKKVLRLLCGNRQEILIVSTAFTVRKYVCKTIRTSRVFFLKRSERNIMRFQFQILEKLYRRGVTVCRTI